MMNSNRITFLECADLSALSHATTCRGEAGDKSPANKAVTSHRTPKVRAFTLIEVLLAVAISAIVLAALNTVFFSALHLRMTTSRSLDASLPLQQALTLLRRDLQGAIPPGTNGDLAGDFKSGAAVNGFGMTQNGGLEFYTSTGVMNNDTPWGDIQRVFYQLRDPANRTASQGKDLIRGVTRNLLSTTMEEPVEQWLMGDVESMEFACYNGTDWRDSWDTSMGDSGLPQAVRVRIQLAANNTGNIRNRQPIEMLVPIESQSRTNQTTGGEQ
jgi:type II secretion system protein J